MSKNNSRKDNSQSKILEAISQEEQLDANIQCFEKWIQQYKRVAIDKLPPMALGDIPISPNAQWQSNQLQEAFLGSWGIIIKHFVNPEDVKKLRNTLDDLMGDYDFLERKLRRRFGDEYGLGSFRTSSTKKNSNTYTPRELHTKLILSQVQNGTFKARECWNNLIYEGKNENLIVDEDIVEIYPEGKKNDVMKLKSKRIPEYEIDFETFARNFSYILKKVNSRKTQKNSEISE